MKKYLITVLAVILSYSSFAKTEIMKKDIIAKKSTTVTFENITASYQKVTNISQKLLLRKFNKLLKTALEDYKTKGSSYIKIRIQAVILNAYIKDQQFFELSTKLNKKWAKKFASKSLQLSRLGQKMSSLNAEKKLKTEEGKKVIFKYRKIGKELSALLRKPVKADKKEYNRQKKIYTAIMKKRVAKARERARSRKVRGNSKSKK